MKEVKIDYGAGAGPGGLVPYTPQKEQDTTRSAPRKEEEEDVVAKSRGITEVPLSEVFPDQGALKKEEPNYLKEDDDDPADTDDPDTPGNKGSDTDLSELRDPQSIEDYYKYGTALGLLAAPEDFEFDGSEEKFQEVVEYTRQKIAEDVEARFLGQVRDPKIHKIVKHAVEGGEFADVGKFFKAVEQEAKYEDIDTSDDEDAKRILRDFYKVKNLKDSKAEALIQNSEDGGTLNEDAEEAKEWFVSEAKKSQAAQQKAAKAAREEDARQVQEYNDKFMKTLSESKIPAAGRSQILDSFREIPLEGGGTAQKWQIIENQVRSNPAHFIQLLQLYANYDPEKGFKFKQAKSKEKSEATGSLFEKLQAANDDSSTRTSRTTQEKPGAAVFSPALGEFTSRIQRI